MEGNYLPDEWFLNAVSRLADPSSHSQLEVEIGCLRFHSKLWRYRTGVVSIRLDFSGWEGLEVWVNHLVPTSNDAQAMLDLCHSCSFSSSFFRLVDCFYALNISPFSLHINDQSISRPDFFPSKRLLSWLLTSRALLFRRVVSSPNVSIVE
jgi:hypothetical protein